MKIIPKLSKRVALAALLCVATNAWADAGASLRILDIEAKVLNPDGSLLAVFFDGVPANSFFSVYAKDGTSQSLSASPLSVSYTLSDRQVLQLSMSYEYTVFDSGQLLGPIHPGAFPPPDASNPCFETNVNSSFEFGYALVGVMPSEYHTCPRAPQPPAGFYLYSTGWHQNVSRRDATADFTEGTSFAGASSHFVLSETFISPGGTYTASDSIMLLLYAQGGPVPVPEPETWGLLLAGGSLLGVALRRRGRRRA